MLRRYDPYAPQHTRMGQNLVRPPADLLTSGGAAESFPAAGVILL
jgi:hypothetical protein